MVLEIIVPFFIGAAIGMALLLWRLKKNRLIWSFMQAQKNNQGIVFLEDETKIMVDTVVDNFQNLAITSSGTIIVITQGSVKPIAGTTMQVVHGDLYKSITTPMALRRFIWERSRDGWTANDIADFLQDIERLESDEDIRKKYKELKESTKVKEELEEEIKELEKKLTSKTTSKSELSTIKTKLVQKFKDLEPYKHLRPADKQKYDVYISLPSSVAAYVNTGLNRVSINLMQELKQRTHSLMMSKQFRHWIQIGVTILLVGVAIMLILKFGGPTLIELFGGNAPPQQPIIPVPDRIAPGG